MARTVYSVQMLALASATGTHTVAVPAGTIWVVRDIDVVYTGSSAGDFVLFQGSAGQTFFIQRWESGTDIWFGWRGRQVLPAGSDLVCTAGGTWHVSVSGYQLAAG